MRINYNKNLQKDFWEKKLGSCALRYRPSFPPDVKPALKKSTLAQKREFDLMVLFPPPPQRACSFPPPFPYPPHQIQTLQNLTRNPNYMYQSCLPPPFCVKTPAGNPELLTPMMRLHGFGGRQAKPLRKSGRWGFGSALWNELRNGGG